MRYDGLDIIGALMDADHEASERLGQMVPLAEAASRAETEYRIAKRKRVLFERNENGTPATYMSDIVGGYEDIAELRFRRDVSEAEREANKEALLLAKKRIDMLREIRQSEWGASKQA